MLLFHLGITRLEHWLSVVLKQHIVWKWRFTLDSKSVYGRASLSSCSCNDSSHSSYLLRARSRWCGPSPDAIFTTLQPKSKQYKLL